MTISPARIAAIEAEHLAADIAAGRIPTAPTAGTEAEADEAIAEAEAAEESHDEDLSKLINEAAQDAQADEGEPTS